MLLWHNDDIEEALPVPATAPEETQRKGERQCCKFSDRVSLMDVSSFKNWHKLASARGGGEVENGGSVPGDSEARNKQEAGHKIIITRT